MNLDRKKRFLLITTHNPFNPAGGSQQRTRLLMDALCRIGHTDLICFTEDPASAIKPESGLDILYFGPVGNRQFSRKKHILNTLKIWSPYALYAKDETCMQVAKNALGKSHYDCIVSRYIEPVLLCGLIDRKDLIIDADDALDMLYYSYFKDISLSRGRRIYFFIRHVLQKYYGNRLYRSALHVFFSNVDNVKQPNTSCLPNIPYTVNLKPATNAPSMDNKTIMFAGTMSYPPNFLGVDIFIEKVWSRVMKVIPEARLVIYGLGTPLALQKKWRKYPGLEIAGFIDNLSKAYENCCIVVVPIFHGAGTNIKILEAMYANRSCVISSFAFKGYGGILIDRHNIMIASSFDEFATRIIELFGDWELNMFIRKHAADTVKKYYSTQMFQSHVEMAFRKLNIID